MKTLNYVISTLAIGFGLTIGGCATTSNSPGVVVGSDFKLGEPIKQFKTFTWATSIDNIPTDQIFIGPGGVHVFNNLSTRSQIKEAIQYELTARGFKNDSSNPDMVINYMIFEQEGQLRTYNGYQVVNGLDSVRTEDNATSVTVEPGTLFVTISGAADQGVLWQGYASGILSEDMVKDPAKIKSAVQRIFNEFDYKAFQD